MAILNLRYDIDGGSCDFSGAPRLRTEQQRSGPDEAEAGVPDGAADVHR